jgi:hypothetical protein
MSEALNRYITAKSYMEACKLIQTSSHYEGSRIIQSVLPLHMLLGFSLELFFKAWLLGKGEGSSEVRAFGHRLAELFSASQASDLPNIAGLGSLVSLVAAPHEDFTYRYIGDGATVTTANWPVVLTVLDDLDVAVDTLLGASVSRGLRPGH